MGTSVNFSDLMRAAGDAPGFTVVPAGDYDVVVDSASSKPTSSGKESIAVQFKVENGPHAGSSLFNQFVLSPENANALAFWFRHMAALGLTEQYFQSNPPLERVAADLIGRRCRVKASTRKWDNQDRNQIDAVLPAVGNAPQAKFSPGSGGPVPNVAPPAPGSQTPSIPGVPAVNAATPTSPAVTPPPPPADDDLPF
jgi:hypothetical protein